MKRFPSFLIAISVASGLLYAAVILAGADDSPTRGESGFLDNIQVGQTLVLVEREPGLYAMLMDRNATLAELQKTLAEFEKATARFSNRALDYRRVTKVAESFIELRGKDPADLTKPSGFDNVTIIPLHAIHSISYYSPEEPGNEK